MCGTYGVVTTVEAIENKINKPLQSAERKVGKYIIRVGDLAPIITDQNPNQIQQFTFGFTPSWAKRRTYLFDVESEGITQNPIFRVSIRKKRCLVPATHIIQGTREHGLEKPYCIHLVGEKPFFLAGVWDEWKNELNGEILRSFALLTCSGNRIQSWLPSERSPVILSASGALAWLRKDEPLTRITGLFKPILEDRMDAYPISPELLKNTLVNDVRLVSPTGQSFWTLHKDKKLAEQRRIELEKRRKISEEEEQENERHKTFLQSLKRT